MEQPVAVVDRQQYAEQPDCHQVHDVVSQQQRCHGGSNVRNHGSEVPEYGVKMIVVCILGELLKAFVLMRIVWPLVRLYQQRNSQICCGFPRSAMSDCSIVNAL